MIYQTILFLVAMHSISSNIEVIEIMIYPLLEVSLHFSIFIHSSSHTIHSVSSHYYFADSFNQWCVIFVFKSKADNCIQHFFFFIISIWTFEPFILHSNIVKWREKKRLSENEMTLWKCKTDVAFTSSYHEVPFMSSKFWVNQSLSLSLPLRTWMVFRLRPLEKKKKMKITTKRRKHSEIVTQC